MPFQVALIAALIKIAIVVGFIMAIVPMLIWLERKVLADFQARIGPNRVGPFGLLQTIADGIKLVTKENIIPRNVDHLLYYMGPVMVMIPALSVGAVVPFGGPVQIGEHVHQLVIADMPVGLLFVLALTSLGVYGIVMAGWASNNKYSLLGGLRSAAQMVSYELPLAFSAVTGVMIASHAAPGGFFSLNLRQVVDLQAGGIWNWAAFNYQFLFLGTVAMITFFICGLAETNRAPFDLPEAETELVGGYHTEYGGLKWSMFFMGEYAAMLNIAAITTTIFLGGWYPPYPSPFAVNTLPYMLEGVVWFFAKGSLLFMLYFWLRASYPRLRYDRLMKWAWTYLLEVTALNIIVVAVLLAAFHRLPVPPVLMHETFAPAPAPLSDPMPPQMPGDHEGLLPPGFPGDFTIPETAPEPGPDLDTPPSGPGPEGGIDLAPIPQEGN
jgi:NADH-quinone oxidoreductase subunit H